ncbi:hypothetical protein J3A83DRAFT_4192413 [Scleroderma citrinum]
MTWMQLILIVLLSRTYEKQTHQDAILTEFEIEHTPDYAEMCVCKAATHAQRFWTSVMNSNPFSQGNQPTKLPKIAMPTYMYWNGEDKKLPVRVKFMTGCTE